MNAALADVVAGRLGLLPFAVGVCQLLERDGPHIAARSRGTSANGACRLLSAADGWVAVNLARDDDIDLVTALTGLSGAAWDDLEATVQVTAADEFVARGAELHMPIAMLGEAAPLGLASRTGSATNLRVVDLSVLWAGPLCAGLLAQAGAEVIRIENRGRPDPTPTAWPGLNRWLNGAKSIVDLDLSTAAGKARLGEEIATADVIVTSARARALASLGLEDQLLNTRPGLIWAAITAHGWAVDRVGFGDDCAVAGGLVAWREGEPQFLGDALADPLTGLEAALAVLDRAQQGHGGRIDLAMARTAAAYGELIGR